MKSTRARFGDHFEIEDNAGTLAAIAAVSTWRNIHDALSPILGARGLDALFAQSLRLNCERFPWLNAVPVWTLEPSGLVALQLVLSRQSTATVDRANATLLDSFRSVLAKLIGDSLSQALLQDVARASATHRAHLSFKRRKTLHEPQRPQLTQVIEQLVLAALSADAAAEAALRNLNEFATASQRDPLTDTPNRAVFLDRLESAIAMARRRNSRVALLFIDLDDFKQINDTLGHPVGDEALKLAARRLTSVLRDSDSVCRYGGDEFLVLLPEICTTADADTTGRKILAALAAPANVEGYTLCLSASLGISCFPDDADEVGNLIVRADAAMYQNKRNRRERLPFGAGRLVDSSTREPVADRHPHSRLALRTAERPPSSDRGR